MATATLSISVKRYCDICDKPANITWGFNHFCGECLTSKRVRAFLLGRSVALAEKA